MSADPAGWIVFPVHALLIVEERLKDQLRRVRTPEGMEVDELALQVMIAADTGHPLDLGRRLGEDVIS